MKDDLIFRTNSPFKTISHDNNSDGWTFLFADDILVEASGFWRVLEKNTIILVSLDHGHQFGLDKPLNLIEELTYILTGKYLTEIAVDKDTADLTLSINHDIAIKILISSSSYETYQFSINGKRYIGLGSGDIEILDKI